jgi:hypothetical protein
MPYTGCCCPWQRARSASEISAKDVEVHQGTASCLGGVGPYTGLSTVCKPPVMCLSQTRIDAVFILK